MTCEICYAVYGGSYLTTAILRTKYRARHYSLFSSDGCNHMGDFPIRGQVLHYFHGGSNIDLTLEFGPSPLAEGG